MERFKIPTAYELSLMHARAGRTMRSVVSAHVAAYDLSVMEWLALSAVTKGNEKGLSMSELALILDVTPPQLSALVNDLVELGFIRQKVLASDRRGRVVTSTARGRRIIQKLDTVLEKAIKSWTAGIPKQQLASYMKTVSELSDEI